MADSARVHTSPLKRPLPSSTLASASARMSTAVATTGSRHPPLVTEDEEMELKEGYKAPIVNHHPHPHSDMMEMDDDAIEVGEVKESDTKKPRLMTHSVDSASTICHRCKQLPTNDQLHLLPCGHTICHSCGIDFFRQNGPNKKSIDCPTCAPDAHHDPSEMLMNQYPTISSSSDSNKKKSICSELDCSEAATHFCKGDKNGKGSCGLLCESHNSSIHQQKKGHQLVSIAEIEQEKAAERKAAERREQVQSRLDDLKELKRMLAPGRKLQTTHKQKVTDCVEVLNSREQSLNEFVAQTQVWIQDANLLKAYYSNSLDRDQLLFAEFTSKISDMEQTLAHPDFTQQQVDENDTLIDAANEFVDQISSVPTKWPVHPVIKFKEKLKTVPKLLPSLTQDLKDHLESFLTESSKSLVNAKLVYKSDWHGWSRLQFIRQCQGKKHTLLLVEVVGKDQRYLFGAYIAPVLIDNHVISDKDRRSFLFSLMNAVNTPVCFSLAYHPESMIDFRNGIGFGLEDEKDEDQNFNFILFFNDRQGNDPSGNSANMYGPKSIYQLDDASKKALGQNQSAMEPKDALAGDEFFGASQIEVYQI